MGAGCMVELGEQRLGLVGLAGGEPGGGGWCERVHARVGAGVFAGGLDQPVGAAAGVMCVAVVELGGELDRAQLDQRVDVAAGFGGGCERGGLVERLLGAAELDEQAGAVAGEVGRHFGEAALLAEGDALLEGGERTGRALQGDAGDGEVVLQHGGVPAGALLDHQNERPLRLGDPSGSPSSARATPWTPSARAGTGNPSFSANVRACSAVSIASARLPAAYRAPASCA